MRNCLLHCTCILFYCSFISTNAQSQLQKIYLNPKAAGGAKQSQFVDSIRFIPLEPQADIRLGDHYNIQIIEKYFLLADYQNKRLLIYSKDGHFLKKISYKKLGNFYPSYNQHKNQVVFFGNNKNYSLTQKDDIKIALAWTDPRNRKYFKKYIIDLNDPLFTIKKSTPDQSDIIQARHFYGNYYWHGQITTSPLYKDSVDYEIKLYNNDQLVKSFFPYNRINEPRFLYGEEESTFANQTDTPNIHFIVRPYCDTIYKMINDSLFPAYQLVTPLENSLPPSFFNRPFKNKTERENFFRNNGWMLHQIYSFYETPKFIFFLVSYLSNYESYIYQKRTNTTYKTKNIKPDSTQYNLQLLADFNILRNGDWFYKPQKAGDLLDFFEENKNATIPKELESFLKSKPPATSPVIVEYKLKN
jgi:hypothetical protein